MNVIWIRFWLLAGIIILTHGLPSSVWSQQHNNRFQFYGQLRSGYYYNEYIHHYGHADVIHEGRARVQLGIQYPVNQKLNVRFRFAGRFSTGENHFRFILRDHTSGDTGLGMGESTFDELNLTWRPTTSLQVRAGRMQFRLPLRGVVPKGLNRYDSPNVAIAYTDGVWVRWSVHQNWNLHAIGEYNSPSGASSAARKPLYFSDPSSRLTLFGMLEHRATDGLWTQREISINFIPNSFIRDGKLKDYMTITSRAGIRLPDFVKFMNTSAGIEFGYAPNSPDFEEMGFEPGQLRSEGSFGWQSALNFHNIFKRHNIGLLYGRIEPGWLVSPSFIPNTETFEVRYQMWFTPMMSFEFRFRHRPELYVPAGQDNGMMINDIYARITYRI